MHHIEKRSLEPHRIGIGRLLLEMAMIVFGILLALNLETCKERRKERELAETALHNIRLEIQRNRLAVAANLPKHKELAAKLRAESDRAEALLSDPKGPLPEKNIVLVLQPTPLFQTAWETAGLTRALARVDYKTLLALSAIYETQRRMTMIEDKWMQAFSNPASFEIRLRDWLLAIFSSLAQNYAYFEESLLKSYDRALNTVLPADNH